MTNDAMALADELKPCPFCGGKAEIERKGTITQSSIIACEDCGCRLESNEVWSIGTKWNTRATAQPAVSTEAEPPAVLVRRAWLKHIIDVLSGPLPSSSGRIGDTVFLLREQFQDILDRAALPAANTAGDVRCSGCGSDWTSADLAAARAADPKIISCCPERKPLDINGWMARAIALEEKLRQALSTPTPAPAVSEDVETPDAG